MALNVIDVQKQLKGFWMTQAEWLDTYKKYQSAWRNDSILSAALAKYGKNTNTSTTSNTTPSANTTTSNTSTTPTGNSTAPNTTQPNTNTAKQSTAPLNNVSVTATQQTSTPKVLTEKMYQDTVTRYLAQGYTQKQVDEAIKKQYAGNVTVTSNVDTFSKNNSFMKVAGTNEVIAKTRADEITRNLEEWRKYSPASFTTKEAFLKAYGNNKSAAELAYLNAYWEKVAPSKTAAIDSAVTDVGNLASDNKTEWIKDAIEDEAIANDKKFTALTENEIDFANKQIDELKNFTDEGAEDYEEIRASLNAAASEAQNVYNQIKEFSNKQYEMALDELAKRKAWMSSWAASKLSGSWVSSATIANAMAEIRNNPAYAKEENDITQNYVTSLNNAINSFTNITNTINNSKAANTAQATELKKYFQSEKQKLESAVKTIQQDGIKAIYDPTINMEAAIRGKVQEEEVKYSANEAESANYRNANTEMRKNMLWDKMYTADNSLDRGKIPQDVWDKAAAMDSVVDARIYLNNYLKNNSTTSTSTSTTTSTGNKTTVPTTNKTSTSKTNTTTSTPNKTVTDKANANAATKQVEAPNIKFNKTVDNTFKQYLATLPKTVTYEQFQRKVAEINAVVQSNSGISASEKAIMAVYANPKNSKYVYDNWKAKQTGVTANTTIN